MASVARRVAECLERQGLEASILYRYSGMVEVEARRDGKLAAVIEMSSKRRTVTIRFFDKTSTPAVRRCLDIILAGVAER